LLRLIAMNTCPLSPHRHSRGLSLVEITLVIGVMLSLAAVITYSVGSMGDWKKGREASESLRSVLIAQKSFLADHPTEPVSELTAAKIIPYLPGRPASLPSAQSLNKEPLTLSVNVMPPVFLLGEEVYDPSGAPDDGLWDVGNL
jgi:type II secretory pathway pseudopilin PulG